MENNNHYNPDEVYYMNTSTVGRIIQPNFANSSSSNSIAEADGSSGNSIVEVDDTEDYTFAEEDSTIEVNDGEDSAIDEPSEQNNSNEGEDITYYPGCRVMPYIIGNFVSLLKFRRLTLKQKPILWSNLNKPCIR